MIEANSLTKRYGGRTAARDVSFRCEPGTVTGFLGPNGAGKSTTLKMLCGLAQPSSGGSQVLGMPFARLPNPGRRVGVLIDASAQHNGRRGAEALTTSAQLMGVESRRVKEMLDLVGLDAGAARKRVGKYSLGMRQRLGIAHALLGDPEVLILDEPANGLDPEGMRWMRALLRDFADRGGTVLLSSHLLGEVQAIADRLIVIARGEIVAHGTPNELTGGVPRTVVRTADGVLADRALRRALAEDEVLVREGPDGGLLTDADPEAVGRAALRGGVALAELRSATDGASLEQLFFELTSDAEPDNDSESNSELLEAAR
ncbi:MAG TPA: ATP-binding cassette domain-containing protein [Solirubrobacteraceae bacterium]|nr:ATP-binding cassette domain-containing protein [Solirubrobacteraceae bacterium]